MIHDFLDPAQLRRDLDAPFASALPPLPRGPVFVLGLHRSGTTFLYQLMADVFPVATTTVYHVTHYKRLLHAQREGLVERYQAEIRAHLEDRGIANRGIDAFPVGPEGLEEYAFILRKHSPKWGFAPASAALFDEMLRKLHALQPGAEALLLKNPHDLLTPDRILARYPEARFVFIRRDPVRVLNSQFRNSFLYRKGPEPYLEMLLAGIPLWRFNFGLMSAADRILPDGLYQRGLLAALRKSIADQLAAHYRAFARLPAHAYVEVQYEALIADPKATLDRIQQFLGLPYRPDARPMPTNARQEPLLEGVSRVAADFRGQLAGCPDAALVG